MQAHHDIEMILQYHHHVDAAQEFAQHDVLVDALPLAKRVAHVCDFFPVLEGRAPSSPQNLERALSVGKSISVSTKPRAFQSAARRVAYCTKWNRKEFDPPHSR